MKIALVVVILQEAEPSRMGSAEDQGGVGELLDDILG
jgi:hypothetical protein